MNCQEIKSVIARHFEEERLEQLPGKYLRHLRECPSCQEYYRRQQRLNTAIKQLSGAEEAEVSLQEVSTELKQEILRRTSGPRKLPHLKRRAAFAAAVLLLTAGLWLVTRIREYQPPEKTPLQTGFYLRSARIDHRPAKTIVYRQEKRQTPLIVWLY